MTPTEAIVEVLARLRDKRKPEMPKEEVMPEAEEDGGPKGLPAHVPWTAANLITGSGSGPELQ